MIFGNRDKVHQPPTPPPGAARHDAGHLLRRSPLLLLAVALTALAVLFAPGAQPVQANHGGNHLTGLGITGTVTRGGDTDYTFQLIPNPIVFDINTASYTIRVPAELGTITFTPTWTGDEIMDVQLYMREDTEESVGNTAKAKVVSSSGSTLSGSSFPGNPHPAIRVRDKNGNAQLYWFDLEFVTDLPSFGGAAVEDRTYTAGHEISFLGFSDEEIDALRLPKATGGFYSHTTTYSVTGLPDGLSLGQGRLIIGTPTAATTEPAEVTFTATDGSGASASLSFDVTVAPPVEYSDADAVRTFKNTIIEYTVGQDTPINMTLPAAEGGHGTLTYGLSYWVKETRTVDGRQVTRHWEYSINDDAPGFSFNSSTRTLTSDTGATAPSAKAFYSVDYWAEDENGARVIASNSITVNEAPTLPSVAWPVWTFGDSVSLTLPEAVGGTRVGIGIRYELEGVDLSALGLSFNGRTRTISGTLTTGLAAGGVDLTYTATDRNGVTAERDFFVTTLSGPSAPMSAPVLTALNAATESGRQIVFLDWADVAGANSYVVQVGADDGSFFPELVFPTLVVDALPEEGSITVYDFQTDLGGGKTGHALITGLTAGDYIVRVAAVNEDGPSPLSNTVQFTVPVGGI